MLKESSGWDGGPDMRPSTRIRIKEYNVSRINTRAKGEAFKGNLERKLKALLVRRPLKIQKPHPNWTESVSIISKYPCKLASVIGDSVKLRYFQAETALKKTTLACEQKPITQSTTEGDLSQRKGRLLQY